MFDFSAPTRQSAKGVFVVILFTLVNQLKKLIPVLIIVVLQWFRDPERIQRYYLHIGIAITLLFLFLIVRGILDFKNFVFYIKEDQFFLRHGILKKSKIVIPKSKIQNIHISQNLVQQLLQVVQVNIDSSGDKGDEIQIRALSRAQADALRSELLRGAANLTIDDVFDTPSSEKDEVIVELNPLDLFLIGLTQNHLRNLMIVIVAIIGFYKDIEDLLEGFGTKVDDKYFSDLYNANVILGSLLIVLFALLLGFMYSIISVFIANFNFSIKKSKASLVIQKGLFNKNQYTVQLNKIQSVEYVTNFLKSIFGLHMLRLFQTATARKTEKKRALVGLRKSHLRQMEGMIFGYQPLSTVVKLKPHKYYLKRLFLMGFLIVLAVNIYFIIIGKPLLFYINFILIPLVMTLLFMRWKKCYYHFDENYFVLGSGGIDTVTSVAEVDKIQSIKYTQSYFQKRRKLVDLHFNTASNKFTVPCIDKAEAIQIYNYILFKIESSVVAWN